MIDKKAKSCCFIGHREINESGELKKNLQKLLSDLINKGVKEFVFGDHSAFNDLCYLEITELKKTYPEIQRIHFRTELPDVNEFTMQLLTIGYEKSCFPDNVYNAGKASYIKRNQAMIKYSDYCVFYFNSDYIPKRKKSTQSNSLPKSGTGQAFNYAKTLNKIIYNLYTV